MINKYSEDYVSGYCSGYTRAEVVGKKMRKDACSQLGTAVLDNLLDVMDGYAAKGYEVIPVDDVKMEICLCIGRLFRKPKPASSSVTEDTSSQPDSAESVDCAESDDSPIKPIKQD